MAPRKTADQLEREALAKRGTPARPAPAAPKPTPKPAASQPRRPSARPAPAPPTTPTPVTPPSPVAPAPVAPAPIEEEAPKADERDDSTELYYLLANIVREYGLEELLMLDSSGAPAGWLWDKVVSGVSGAQFLLELEQTQAFKRRYPAITELRRQAAAGQPVRVPTVNEVRAYEQQVAATMRMAGLPTWFYDEYSDIQDLMVKNLSAVEVEQRLGEAWTRTQQTDPQIRSAFDQFYGVGEGDAALAAFFLDPQRTVVSLERASRAAFTAGMGRRAGIDINRDIAERVAVSGRSDAGIQEDIQEINRLRGVFEETMGERDLDLEAGTTGVEAILLGSGEAQQAIERRVMQRRAQVQSTTGGAAVTQRGAVGLQQL